VQSKIKLINFIDISSEEKKMVLSWRNHQDIRKWMINKKEISLEEHLNYINSLYTKNDRVYFLVKESNEYIGVVDLTNIVEKEFAEFGIYAKPDCIGVGSKLMRTIVDYAFKILKLKKLIANVYINNEKAIKLYKKFNFKEIRVDTDSNGKFVQMELKNENR
jgi:UDP-4-amino-4,6-dideoxy-N-acetyl-beta-L-altrosamine N-acetyltransferase